MISQMLSIDQTSGLILVLSTVVLIPGLLMFWFRGGQRGGAPKSHTHFVVERSFILAASVISVIGFVLLAGTMQNAQGNVLSAIGATAYLIAGVLIVAAEALGVEMGYEKLYRLIVVYVVIAFLAQAVIGGALLQSGLVAAWIGWACIVWNIGWLVVLPLISPRDIYFPILHSITPLLAGIALLIK